MLKSSEMKDAVAVMASRNELTNLRSFEFVNTIVAERLSKPLPKKSEAIFSDRPITEAIILEKIRPVLLVQNGKYAVARVPEVEAAIAPHRHKLAHKINAVGRIELSQHDSMSWCGTGWLLADNLIVTNRHVAELFAQASGRKFRFRLNQRGRMVSARIDFREEHNIAENNEFGIGEVLWIAENSDAAPDMAVLKVRSSEGLPEPLEIAGKDAISDQWIGVVGYPAYDDRNDSSLMKQIFENIFEVKRFAPGRIVTTDKNQWYLTHEATTLGGNSGSAVLDLENGKVVGLHFGGSFKETNYAVKASVLKKIIARRSWIPVSRRELEIQDEAFHDRRRTLQDMRDRAGFDAMFLGSGKSVILPKTGSSHDVLDVAFENNALPYTHFSIVMSKSRRLAIVTAENIDGNLKIKLKRNDTWGYDPRIDKNLQVGHQDFYGPQPFDKGHLVRRENPGWGTTVEEARLGEDDTFIYTNAAPQMPGLNQKTWLSLEDYVLDNVRTHGFKACVFTGPIFKKDDPIHAEVQIPLEFWKVIVTLDAETEKLLTSAYLLSQESIMPTEGFRFGPFKTYQIPVSHIEKEADIKFSKTVREADVFHGTPAETLAVSMRFLEITGPADVVLKKI
ncbi:MAG: DNA/RNA non-specific endonuclease [Nitrosomonas sp.]|nr:MAG: DNA/RNA non-specific endonuclease [Nitrosomonas sp.]